MKDPDKDPLNNKENNTDKPTEEEKKDVQKEETPRTPEETLQDERNQWQDRALRATAELENFRKRMAREKSDAIRYANESLLHSLFPLLDNFQLGMQAAQKEADSMLYKGMEMVQKQLEDFLSHQGVDTITLKSGDDFDPTLHEALKQQEDEKIPEGKILSQIRCGYRLGERLLRPANVIVSSGSSGQKKEA